MPTDYYMFNESQITEFIEDNGGRLVDCGFLYLGTPYEDYEEDVLKVAKGIKLKREGKQIDFTSPPFFDNVVSLVYKKTK